MIKWMKRRDKKEEAQWIWRELREQERLEWQAEEEEEEEEENEDDDLTF